MNKAQQILAQLFEETKAEYIPEFKRVNGIEFEGKITYNRGWVDIRGSKLRLSDFIAILTKFKSLPDLGNK